MSPAPPPIGVTLDNRPYPERALSPQATCYISGKYKRDNTLSEGRWSLPCTQYDRLDVGQTVTLEAWGNTVKLAGDDKNVQGTPEPARAAVN